MNSGPLITNIDELLSFAIDRASNVFPRGNRYIYTRRKKIDDPYSLLLLVLNLPVPGGPYNSTPLGGFKPIGEVSERKNG